MRAVGAQTEQPLSLPPMKLGYGIGSEVPLKGDPSSAEKIFIVLVLLLSTGSFSNLWIRPEELIQEARTQMLVMQVIWSAVYLVSLAMLRRHCDDFLRRILREWPLVALAVLPVLSVIWSDAPALTARRLLIVLSIRKTSPPKTGVFPRSAQAAMRHSRTDLRMNIYTDPVALDVAPAVGQTCQNLSIPGKIGG